MYGGESWTIKKAKHWIIDAFQQWCWRRLLTVSWTARRSKQSILKEISPEYILEGWILKLQYFCSLMQRVDLLEKTLMLGKTEDRSRRGQQRIRWLDGITNSMDMVWATPGESEGWGSLVCCSSWGHKESDMTDQLNDNIAFLIKCLLMPITNFYYIAFLVLWNIVEYSRTRTYPSERSRKYTLLMPSKHNVSCEFSYHHEILWLVLQSMGWLFLLTPFYFTQAQSCSHRFVSGDL